MVSLHKIDENIQIYRRKTFLVYMYKQKRYLLVRAYVNTYSPAQSLSSLGKRKVKISI